MTIFIVLEGPNEEFDGKQSYRMQWLRLALQMTRGRIFDPLGQTNGFGREHHHDTSLRILASLTGLLSTYMAVVRMFE